MSESGQRGNPYVGPRAFTRGDRLYGRDRELRRLLNLLIAERIVLMYSPSGAGKTSLIQAALIPGLEEEGFRAWPTMRVNRELPPEERGGSEANRYVLSLILALEEGLPKEEQAPVDQLVSMTLDDYLGKRTAGESEAFDDVFVFDQFEEILTLDPTDRDVKIEFFEQLGAMLQNRRRWALFAMREEFIAGLDPYLRPIPTRFSATFRLELLSPNAARQAMQKPATAVDVTFTESAAGKLVDDLRTVRVLQPDGTMGKRLGLYVEPVQLQVVCRHLWDRLLPPEGSQIVEADLEVVGDVDRALADFYADRVAAIAADTGVSERAIRDWIDGQLITEQGIRGQVLQGPVRSRGLENRVIWRLVDAHLVRAEDRRGATWFELAHDRLIEPVRADNAAWREKHLGLLQRQAALWQREGRSVDLLLRGPALMEAERWAAHHGPELTDLERDFLAACRDSLSLLERQAIEWESQGRPGHLLLRDQALVETEGWATAHPAELTGIERAFLQSSQEARVVAEREQRQNRRIRWLAVGASLFAIIAFGLFVVASFQTRAAQSAAMEARLAATAEAVARSEAEVAATAEATAREGAEAAVTAEATAREGAEVAATAEATALELAIAAVTDAVAAQQTAEADRVFAVTSLADAESGLSAASTALALSQERSGMIQALEATNQALATQLTPTPSTTPTPTGTPQPGTPGPSPSPTLTASPTTTATSTPNWTATTAAEATAAQLANEQLEQIRLTQTAVAQALKPTATPVPVVCQDEPEGEFQSIWKTYKDRLGCPRQIEPTKFAQFAEQQFERGFMFWSEKPRDLILAISRGDDPVWYERRSWSFDPDSAWCASTPPPGLVQPIRGLGGAWCDSPEIRKAIGWAVEKERVIQGAVQEFDNGFIMRTGDPTKVYVLFRDDRTYAVEKPR
jgi:hypothetical protein